MSLVQLTPNSPILLHMVRFYTKTLNLGKPSSVLKNLSLWHLTSIFKASFYLFSSGKNALVIVKLILTSIKKVTSNFYFILFYFVGVSSSYKVWTLRTCLGNTFLFYFFIYIYIFYYFSKIFLEYFLKFKILFKFYFPSKHNFKKQVLSKFEILNIIQKNKK
jgi:hypothetical protein